MRDVLDIGKIINTKQLQQFFVLVIKTSVHLYSLQQRILFCEIVEIKMNHLVIVVSTHFLWSQYSLFELCFIHSHQLHNDVCIQFADFLLFNHRKEMLKEKYLFLKAPEKGFIFRHLFSRHCFN